MFDYDIKKGEIPNYIEILSNARRKLVRYLQKSKISFSYGTRLLNLSRSYSVFTNINNAKKFDQKILRLPCGPGYSLAKINKIINILNNFS